MSNRSLPLLLVCLLMTAVVGCAGVQTGTVRSKGADDGHRLRVVSYNIALGAFLQARSPQSRRLSRTDYSIRAALAHHPHLAGFDILGLQEVCSDDEQLAILSSRGRNNVYFGRADPSEPAECSKGQAVITPHPIVGAGVIHLPRIRSVGRSAVWADIQVKRGDTKTLVRVYNVHLDNRGKSRIAHKGRWQQMEAVLEHYQAWRTTNPDLPVVVLGDFNSVGRLVDPWVREKAIVETSARLTPTVPEYESTHILSYQTDWIFYESMFLLRSQVVDLLRSDHFPVVADFRLE